MLKNYKYKRIILASALVLFTALLAINSGLSAANSVYQNSSTIEENSGYVSPYSLNFSVPKEDLTFDFGESPRNDWKLEAEMPYSDWYTEKTKDEFGSWGPHAAQYPAVQDLNKKGKIWIQERLVATAEKFIGYHYQHHHIPDWLPPLNWPWKNVSFGQNSKGIDCSDFSSFVYNYGLGIKLETDVKEQASSKIISGPGGIGTVKAQIIPNPGSYQDLIKTLETGDLLYIRSSASDPNSDVSHVIMWLGKVGSSPDGCPLIIDCHDQDVPDMNGRQIPHGVQIRPFAEDSWYYKAFDHAHRIIGFPTDAPRGSA